MWDRKVGTDFSVQCVVEDKAAETKSRLRNIYACPPYFGSKC